VPDETKKQNKTGSDPSQGAQEDPFAARGVVVGVRPSDHMLVKVAATRIREAGAIERALDDGSAAVSTIANRKYAARNQD